MFQMLADVCYIIISIIITIAMPPIDGTLAEVFIS